MTITKELAYKYIKYMGIMDEYTDNFFIADIYIYPSEPGVKEHLVITCGYLVEDYPYKASHKNVHVHYSDIKKCLKEMRLKKLDEIL